MKKEELVKAFHLGEYIKTKDTRLYLVQFLIRGYALV